MVWKKASPTEQVIYVDLFEDQVQTYCSNCGDKIKKQKGKIYCLRCFLDLKSQLLNLFQTQKNY